MKAFWSKIVDDDLPTLAAALSYYSALSLAPLAVIMVVVVSYLPSSVQDLIAQIQLMFGSPAADMASRIVERSQQPSLRTWAGALSLGVSLIFASAMFAQLQTSLNRIFEVKTRPLRVWFLKRLFSVGLVFVFILFLFLSSILLQFLNAWNVEHYRWVLMFLSALLALRFLPEKKTHWIPAIVGSLVTTFGFELGNALFGVYLKATAVASAYGATGALLAFLLWIYYSALILLFGAEVCYALSYRRR